MKRASPILIVAILLSPGAAGEERSANGGDLVMTDREFLSALDLDRPGLKEIRGAVEAGDLEKAKAELIEYFRSRNRPGLAEKSRDPKDCPEAVTEKGEKAYEGHFKSIDGHIAYIGKKVDWFHYPKVVDNRYQYTMVMALNWHETLADLASAYWETGNHKYARECYRHLLDWTRKMAPFPERPPERGTWIIPWKQVNYVVPRISRWLSCYFKTRDCPAIAVDDRITVLKGILAQIRYVAKNEVPCGNMIMNIARNRMRYGVLLPEFREAKSWREGGIARVRRLMDEVFYQDGAYIELCYFGAVRGFLKAKDYAEANQIPVPAGYMKKVEQFYEFMMYFLAPSGWGPLMNDYYSVGGRASGPANMGSWVAEGAKLFGREDMRYVNTRGRAGKPPRYTSRAFPYAGVYVMRSDWTGQAHYLVFDGGTSTGTHNHIDKLDFELYPFGRKLIIGTGCGGPWGSKWRDDYYVGTAGHNTIIVDGRGQVRHFPDFPKDHFVTVKDLSPEPLSNVWVSSANFDYVRSTYEDGYGTRGSERVPWLRPAESDDPHEKLRLEMELEEPVTTPEDRAMVTHERSIFFLKPDYWIMSDLVRGEGEHKIESLLHFLPAAKVETDEATGVLSAELFGSGLLVIPADPRQAELRIVRGQKDPIQGWVPGRWGKHLPAPAAVYTAQKRLPVVLDSVLYPYRAGKRPNVSVTDLSAEGAAVGPPKACALKVTVGDQTDYYVNARQKRPGARRFTSLESDGQVVALRTHAGQQVKRVFMVGGTYLKWNGKGLLEADEVLSRLHVAYRGKLLEVSCEPSVRLRILARGVEKAIYNGHGCEVVDGSAHVLLPASGGP